MPGVRKGALLATLLLCIAAFQGDDVSGNQAVVVVRYDDERSDARCVSFEEEQITGLELLVRSGLQLATKVEGMGVIACGIEGTGCPANDCFCQCSGGDSCVYWSYWRRGEEGWRYAQYGASSAQVTDGTVDGWSWGPGTLVEAIEPPEVEFSQVCSQAASISNSVPDPSGAGGSSLTDYLSYGLILVVIGGAAFLLNRRRAQ